MIHPLLILFCGLICAIMFLNTMFNIAIVLIGVSLLTSIGFMVIT